MNDDLYFVPLIADALRSDDPESALESALHQIQDDGLRLVDPRPWQQFCAFMQEVRASLAIEFGVRQESHLVGHITARAGMGVGVLSGIVAGSYEIRLSTGRVVWRAELTDEDLLWHAAYPGENLKMAADSDEVVNTPSRRELLLDGEVELLLFPGISSGGIGMRLRTTLSRG